MEEKKISIRFTTAIFIASIMIVLTLTIIGFIMYNIIHSNNHSNENIYQEKRREDNLVLKGESYEKQNKNETNNIRTDTNSNEGIKEESLRDEGEKSTKYSPLKAGKWGIASQRKSGKYVDVPTRIVKITRGTNAEKEVKEYCNDGTSIYRYSEPEEGMEWAVIEYEVDLRKFSEDMSIALTSKITGTGENTSVKYKNDIYVISTMNMTTGYAKSKIETAKFAMQLPIGCTDYLIVLGAMDETQAFFEGQ